MTLSNNKKTLKPWHVILGSFLIILILVGRIAIKSSQDKNDITFSIDYYSYHAPKLVQLDKDVSAMVDIVLSISHGNTDQSEYDKLLDSIDAVEADIHDIDAYSGDVPFRFKEADALLSTATTELLDVTSTLYADESIAMSSGNVTEFTNDAQKVIDARNHYKQAADLMIKNRDK